MQLQFNKKIIFFIFLFLFFYIILSNNNVYATSYSVSEYYTINTDTDPYSGQSGSITSTTYYFEYPFDTDSYDYVLVADVFSTSSSDYLNFMFITWDNTAEEPYLMFKYISDSTFYLYLVDGSDDNALDCTIYTAVLSTDSTEPTSSDDFKSYSNSSNPLYFYYYIASWKTTRGMSWSDFRLYYSDINIYYHDGSSKGDALFTQSVATQILTVEVLEMLPTTIAETMTILVPVGLVIFGILFVVFLVRYWIWRVR